MRQMNTANRRALGHFCISMSAVRFTRIATEIDRSLTHVLNIWQRNVTERQTNANFDSRVSEQIVYVSHKQPKVRRSAVACFSVSLSVRVYRYWICWLCHPLILLSLSCSLCSVICSGRVDFPLICSSPSCDAA